MTDLDISVLLDAAYRALEDELHRQLDVAGFADIRPAHGQVFETIGQDGNRVTAMAEQARITKGSMVELVDYLAARGYLERSPDPSDGRAKIIRLTPRGWDAVRVAVAALADVENRWQLALGPRRMSNLRRALGELPGLLVRADPAPPSTALT